jgi:origin recognition complex subunit 6
LLAGVESVICLPCPSDPNGEGGKGVEGKIPALIAALWFFVVVKMRGKEGQGKENIQRKKMARDVLAGAQGDEWVREKVGEEEGAWEGWEQVVDKDVNTWRMEIVEKGWREMDWFRNIVEGCGVDGDGESDDDGSNDEDDDIIEEIENGVRRPAVGSMIQEKYNYLSLAKRKEYAAWEGMMLAKIRKMIADGGIDTEMEG